MADTLRKIETYQKVAEWMRIGRTAVGKAQEESRRLGVPNVYSFNGKTYYELPNGDIVRELPPDYALKFPALPAGTTAEGSSSAPASS